MKSQKNNLVKLSKNWLPLVVLNWRRQMKLRTSMKKGKKYTEEFANFDIFANWLDDFIVPVLSAKKLDILSKVYIFLFCLSHGQSSVDRGFSMNKEYIKENQSDNCLVSLRIIHNHLTSNKLETYCYQYYHNSRYNKIC